MEHTSYEALFISCEFNVFPKEKICVSYLYTWYILVLFKKYVVHSRAMTQKTRLIVRTLKLIRITAHVQIYHNFR